MFDNVISEQSYHTYSYCTTLCSILANSCLIVILLFTQLNHVRAYRWLLFSFAIVDILISLNHTYMFPAAHLTEFGYIVFGFRFIEKSTDFGIYASLAWVFLFYLSYVLLAFHYVYRYVIIFNVIRGAIGSLVFIDILYAGSIVGLAIIGWLPNEESRRAFAPMLKEAYGIDLFAGNKPGYLALTYWIRQDDGRKVFTPWPVCTLIFIFAIIFSAVIVIFLCLIRILQEMRRTARSHNLESKTNGMQRILIRALLWQTVIPTISSYIPIAFIILFPLFFEISLGGLATVGFMSMELFPILDPLIIIYCITGGRSPTFFRGAEVGPLAPASDMTTRAQEARSSAVLAQ